MTRLVHDYADAYMTCYRWLFQHCPPWRWLLSLAMWPGSTSYKTLSRLRDTVRVA